MRSGREREPRLDPVRWRAPGRAALLRGGLAGVLLLAAAGVLYARDPVACAGQPPPAPAASPAPIAPPASGAPGSAAPGPSTRPDGGAPRTGGTGPQSGNAASRAGSAAPQADGGVPRSGRPAVPAGLVGVPLRLAEPAALLLVRPGDRVDLLVVRAAGGTPRPLAAGAAVLGVVGDTAPDAVPGSAALFVALTRRQADQAVGAPQDARFAVLVRP